MSRAPWVDHAARVSFLSPLVAVALMLAVRSLPMSLPARYFAMGVSFFVVTVIGFACALVAVYMWKQAEGSRFRFRATVGMIANAGLLAVLSLDAI